MISGGVEVNSRFHIVFYEEMKIYRQNRIPFLVEKWDPVLGPWDSQDLCDTRGGGTLQPVGSWDLQDPWMD